MPPRIDLRTLPAWAREQVAAKAPGVSPSGRRRSPSTDGAGLELAMLRQIRAMGLAEPETQYRFATGRHWRADFAWPYHRLLVEVDGGVWVGGRHVQPLGYIADRRRDCEAVCSDWSVLRVTREMIEDGTAVEFIRRALALSDGVTPCA